MEKWKRIHEDLR